VRLQAMQQRISVMIGNQQYNGETNSKFAPAKWVMRRLKQGKRRRKEFILVRRFHSRQWRGGTLPDIAQSSRIKQKGLLIMSSQAAPSFNEWVECCFTQGHRDFHSDYEGAEYDAYQQRERMFMCMDVVVLAGYITRLFNEPQFIVERFTDNQIADAVWFIFGIASSRLSHGASC